MFTTYVLKFKPDVVSPGNNQFSGVVIAKSVSGSKESWHESLFRDMLRLNLKKGIGEEAFNEIEPNLEFCWQEV